MHICMNGPSVLVSVYFGSFPDVISIMWSSVGSICISETLIFDLKHVFLNNSLKRNESKQRESQTLKPVQLAESLLLFKLHSAIECPAPQPIRRAVASVRPGTGRGCVMSQREPSPHIPCSFQPQEKIRPPEERQ